MTFLDIMEILNYCLVLIYGLLLSVEIVGGVQDGRHERLIFALCPVFLLIQGLGWLIFGTQAVRQAYPLLVHMPLALILIFVLKKRVSMVLVSVSTAYLLCQLPRWVELMVWDVTGSPMAGEIVYTCCIALLFYLLRRYFAPAAYSTMSYSRRSLLLFGSLPVGYYIFDYMTTVYSDAFQMISMALVEFLPTALIAFYVLFLTTYHVQMQKGTQLELQSSILEAQLKRAQTEMDGLRRIEMQTAIYRHDMRHHLTAIGGFIAADDREKALAYIRRVEEDAAAIVPKRYSGNETVDLLCSAFFERAERLNVRLTVDAALPREISISDTELSAVIANGLENALKAVKKLDAGRRWVRFYCEVKHGRLLIEVSNPHAGRIVMRDGLPVSGRDGHGYGCRSIRAIIQRMGGMCLFESENGIFTFRAALPERGETSQTT